MKKVVLFFVLAVMFCPVFNTVKAEAPIYTLSVSKSNGGFLSMVNLYGIVNYSETFDEMCNVINAELRCFGQGFTRCRVPSDAGNYVAPLHTSHFPASFASSINELLEQSEGKVEQGVLRGVGTKKVIATQDVRLANDNRRMMYVYSSRWDCNNAGEGTITINLFKTDASILGF